MVFFIYHNFHKYLVLSISKRCANLNHFLQMIQIQSIFLIVITKELINTIILIIQ